MFPNPFKRPAPHKQPLFAPSTLKLSEKVHWLARMYIWAGPHHLHYTALPDWAQSLGMVMSLILLAPSWGGMINGMMTLSGAWHKLRDDPILRFLVVSLAFYGMSTFEGPMMAIKTVNALSHYTDWTIGHVAQLLEDVHEFAVALDLAVVQLEGMQEVVLVVALGIAGEEDLAVAVALDPEVVGIVGLEDLDVVPLPIREAFQRPHRVLGQLVLATNDDGRAGIGGP